MYVTGENIIYEICLDYIFCILLINYWTVNSKKLIVFISDEYENSKVKKYVHGNLMLSILIKVWKVKICF